jgi:hypothetical protein
MPVGGREGEDSSECVPYINNDEKNKSDRQTFINIRLCLYLGGGSVGVGVNCLLVKK